MKRIVIILIGLLFISGCGTQLGATNKLKAPKEKILKAETLIDEEGNKFVKYDYISSVEVPAFSDKEDLSKRTYNSYTEKTDKKINDKEVLRTTFFSGAPFIKEGTKWMQTETATSTEQDYSDSIKLSLFDRFKGLLGSIVYAATTTTYPGTTVEDGYAQLSYASGSGVSFSSLRNGNGSTADYTGTNPTFYLYRTITTAGQYNILSRAIFQFNTSIIGSATITSSTLSAVITLSVTNPPTTTLNFSLTQASAASSTAILASDYEGTVSYNTRFTDSFPTSTFPGSGTAYVNFPLNASGLANINTSGISKFAFRNNWDIDNTTPVWVASSRIQPTIYFSNYTGTSLDPKLVIEYTTSTPVVSQIQPNILFIE